VRQLLHTIVGLAFWVLFILLWGTLWFQHKASGAALLDSFARLAVCAGIVFGLTLWWVSHNVSIYRRKGPRTGRPTVQPQLEHDRLGRALVWALDGGADAARSAGHVVIEVESDLKSYASA
jgi:hypothetical protein